ncbi:3-oxo-5-beta-steroid 4-dehydrogenase-like isoform X2 [Poecilia latipinna]|uniref:3-oxo-5-beta-steroid 4-dehydrogenase-like isoform X2 n=1 Tax=Poecilia latipinna TaxID=48699 RepID=UPI00044414D4|nr:PREDICTED: 3-oxo-5-beta-steroid 4-dehydrogenase-like isoform X2 [Poecilia latipinna]XP_016519352.1 PREDICTED: 3-oxo-5-beta-steroid 4-dehydrogenase-like isoform X2 [Poecilia formosa]
MALTPKNHSVPLSDGNSIPLIGLGTYSNPQNTPKGTALAAVKRAIEVGYRHIDGALIYCNEDEVGQAIREKIADGTVKREDIFYCGKPGDTFYPQDENGKCAYHKTDLCATWEAMEACKDAGLAKSIGVSNFNKRQLELILNKPGLKHKPVTNQVECHPYFTQPKLREYCQEKNIVIVGYSPLGTNRDPSWVNLECPPMLEDQLLTSIAKKYKKTTAQVCLRFNMQRGVVVIPKSFNLDRIKDNFQVFDFSLSEEEMKAIEGLNKNIRFVVLPFWADHPEYPFHEEY